MKELLFSFFGALLGGTAGALVVLFLFLRGALKGAMRDMEDEDRAARHRRGGAPGAAGQQPPQAAPSANQHLPLASLGCDGSATAEMPVVPSDRDRALWRPYVDESGAPVPARGSDDTVVLTRQQAQAVLRTAAHGNGGGQ